MRIPLKTIVRANIIRPLHTRPLPILLILLIGGIGVQTVTSCTTNIEPPPPPQLSSSSDLPPSSSSAANTNGYCIYQGIAECYSPTSGICPGTGGALVNFCPYGSSSSLAEIAGSSSSIQDGQSSSSNGIVTPEYGYCVFEAERTCLSGTLTICPPGGTLSNACPYNSSSSVGGLSSSGNAGGVSSSVLSGLPSSSSQGGGQVEGNVFTDPRDGKKYKFEVAPDGKIWMSENLDYSRGNTLGYCYGVDRDGENPHKDSTSCGSGYGRVYEWSVAIDGNSPQGLCPNGWHIPSTAEWSTIVGNRKMPVDFYIFSGTTDYPPLDWKERDRNGFYWTSSGSLYFTGLWHGSGYDIYEVEAKTMTPEDAPYFSVRCIANDDFDLKLNCGSSTYNYSTQFCSKATVYDKCGGKTYNLETEFCSGTTVYSKCGGKIYNPATEFCSGTAAYAFCGGNRYNPVLEECISGVVMDKPNYIIECVGRVMDSNCGGANKTTVSLAAGQCVEIYVMGYTESNYLPTLIMRCNTEGNTQNNLSLTLALNEKVHTFTGSWVWNGEIRLGSVKLGDNNFGTLCLTAISGASSVKCELGQ